MQQANDFLQKKLFLNCINDFKKPQDETSVFVPWLDANKRLEDILCIQQNRIVVMC